MTNILSKEEKIESHEKALRKYLQRDERRKEAYKRRVKRFTTCVDCTETNWDDFVIHDEIWNSVAGRLEGRLHLSCFEKRLDRLLKLEDFRDLPVNHMLKLGYSIGIRQ